MRIDYLASTTQERIRDLLRPVKGEVEDPKKARITQAELARLLDVNEGTVSRFMSGKTLTITNENLVKIATRLNVSTDYLLSLDEGVKLDITALNEQEQEMVIRLVDYFKSMKE